MTEHSFPYTKKDLKKLDPDFKIGAIVADGMWYSLPKWRRLAKVTEEEINDWVERHMNNGYLSQSPTGARSYRITHEQVLEWHREHGLEVGDQIFDFIFPARVWDGVTEVEGFLATPLRDIGIVSFRCTTQVANDVTEALRGIARVREAEPGLYKAYGLSANYIKPIITEVFARYPASEAYDTYSRGSSMRRELVDFSEPFAHHMISFYRAFAKSLLKKFMDTIKIYIPEPQDQESQIIAWVIEAIEKFDESASVPFSGYLNSAIKHRPYDLPNRQLGSDLSNYQRDRSRAVNRLREKLGDTSASFSATTLADEMGMRLSDFTTLEEKHHVWLKTKTATTLTWEENSEEKGGEQVMGSAVTGSRQSDRKQCHALSAALIAAAIHTEKFEDAFSIISQMGAEEINLGKVKAASEDFILRLGVELGMGLNDDEDSSNGDAA